MEQVRGIAKLCSRLTTAISLFIVIGIPIFFFTYIYHAEVRSLETELEITSAIINRTIRLNPEFWKYDQETLTGLLRSRKADQPDHSAYIILPDQMVVAQQVLTANGPFFSRTQDLTDAGKIVAKLLIERPLTPLIKQTAVVVAIALIFASGLFYILGHLPLRAIKKAEKTLKNTHDFLRKVMEGTTNAIFVVDLKGNILMSNHQSIALSGYSNQEIHGLSFQQLFSSQDYAEIEPRINKLIQDGQPFTKVETCLLRPDGALISVNCGAAPLLRDDSIDNTIWTFEDVTARKLAEDEIERLAYYDSLTALPNRTLLLDRLDQAINRVESDDSQTAILFLDLDRFKDINDALGHNVGDQLLKEVAKRLQGCLRDIDTIARYGGDEFVIILAQLPSNHEEYTSQVARKIQQELERPMEVDGKELYTSCSIGISIFPLDGQDSLSLLKHADLAMYQAKGNGRNDFQFFSIELNQKIHDRIKMENSLRQALEQKQLYLHYQPKLDLATGQISGMEVLSRWKHPEIGAVRPDRFIAIAEESGLIHPLGSWVLHTACRQHMEWHRAGLNPPPLSINLSIRQLQQQSLISLLDSILKETGLPAHQLELELTESCLMESSEDLINKLSALRGLGVKIAIDDFGTGYSSLGYLKHLPVDRLKVDRCFIMDICNSSSDSKIAQAIIAMAKSLGLQVTAEGVELEEQLNLLIKHGCDEIQGYLYSRPLPTEQMEEFLAKEV